MLQNSKNKPMDAQTLIILIVIGIGAGLLSGLVGVGGGIVIVPALIYFLGFSQFSAQGTSLGLLMLPVGFLAVWQYHKLGHVDYKIVLIIAIGFVAGSYFGGKISLSLPQETMKKFFAILLFIIAIKMFFFDKKKNDDAHSTTNNIEQQQNKKV